MRLVQKLSLAFLFGTTTILAVNGYFRVRREVALFQADRVRDHDLIGRALSASFGAIWRSEGEPGAMQLLKAANAGEGRIRIRWVWMPSSVPLHIDTSRVAELAPGTTLTLIAPDARGERERYTYAPVRIGERVGTLELAETLDTERRYTQRTIVETVLTTATLALVTTLVSYVLGFWFVGRPMRALIAKAYRIGLGEFAGPVRLRQHDELAELAAEMNLTGDKLVEANERATREEAGRIAAIEQLRHADRLTTVGKLASGVAHELGTPLNVVVARAQMIASGEASPRESREYAGVIVDSAQKMTRIIRQLLEFARRRGPRKESKDLTAIATRALDLLRPLAEREGVELATEAGDGPCEASVEAAQIEQALTNLVVNAVQASHAGGEVRVSVHREKAQPPADHGGPEGEWIALRVHDDGDGIAPENLAHVFEPFFTTKDVGRGTGLGLSVAYGIVHDHGGWFDVQSAPGHGSTFAFFLPAS